MEFTMKRIILLTLLAFSSLSAIADTLTLKAGHPDTYVVTKGDTLWDISGYFLNDPWRWPTLWGVNPQIANPHLIYPGDQLTLVFIDGQPRLMVNQNGQHKQHLKKSVEGRIASKGGPIPAVDLALIQSYLVQNRVVDGEWFNGLPMILSGESESKHHIVGDVVYINQELPNGTKVAVYYKGQEFIKKDTEESLGVEIIFTASGRVFESGKISKVKLLSSLRETKGGYRVAPVEDEALMSAYFTPKAADIDVPTSVIGISSGIREAGKLDVVYLDRGGNDGVEPGHVFAMYRDGEDIVLDNDEQPVREGEHSAYNRFMAYFSEDTIQKMPDVYHGNLMVFKVFDKTSMGLIMTNERPVRVDDRLVTPTSVKLKAE